MRVLLAYWKIALELALVFAFLLYAFLSWSDLRSIIQRLTVGGLVGFFAAYLFGLLLSAAATTRFFSALGYRRSYFKVLSIHLRRLPAKYLPGGIWHTVGRGADLVASGIPANVVTSTLIAEQGLAVWWSGFLGFSLAIVAFQDHLRKIAIFGMLLWLVGAWALSFVPSRRPAIRNLSHCASDPTLNAMYALGWGCLTFAFHAYISDALTQQSSSLQICASYLLSWTAGALAFFAPQGMGIFELSMSKVLSSTGLSSANLLWLVASYRIAVLAVDLFAWLVWLTYHHAHRQTRARS